MSDKDKAKSFSELLDSQVKSISEDKYDIKNFGESKKEGRLDLKWKRIKATLFGDSGVSGKFIQGVTMGATVGAVAGTLFGLLSYMQHRRLIYVPIIACSMAISFGFFMGVGTVIRTENDVVLMDRISFIDNKMIIEPPLWKEKYRRIR